MKSDDILILIAVFVLIMLLLKSKKKYEPMPHMQYFPKGETRHRRNWLDRLGW